MSPTLNLSSYLAVTVMIVLMFVAAVKGAESYDQQQIEGDLR